MSVESNKKFYDELAKNDDLKKEVLEVQKKSKDEGEKVLMEALSGSQYCGGVDLAGGAYDVDSLCTCLVAGCGGQIILSVFTLMKQRRIFLKL